MNSDTLEKINSLNREFYLAHGDDFSKTRGRIQPGVGRLLQRVEPSWSILDVGCGNGTFARALSDIDYSGQFVGLDFSQPLLNDAERSTSKNNFHYYKTDLTEPWPDVLGSIFDLVVSFAVIHHIASVEQRKFLVSNMYHNLKPNGLVFISTWQFMNSPKLAKKVIDWNTAGISQDQVDPGDHLVDWRGGSVGLRYAHMFSSGELAELGTGCGFEVIDTFWADGSTGDLGLYQVWRK